MTKSRTYARFLVVFLLLGGLGIAATLYTLVHQRLPLPFGDNYTVKVEFDAANGVISGLGQPVNVVGVKVGQVGGARLADGRALVTLQIDRHKVPVIYANATATLEPITPLQDMQINLDPGGPPAATLPSGAAISIAQTSTPVQLSTLLSTLDGDTRAYLSSLIASLGQGTNGAGSSIKRLFVAMSPTARDLRLISQALAARRIQLARLVHNLAAVTRAATQDRQLAGLVAAGDQTVHALAIEQAPLRQALRDFPPTLSVTRATLVDLQPFASQLGVTLDALEPAIRRLPATLAKLEPFARKGTRVLSQDVRPLVRDAIPVLAPLAPSVRLLNEATPYLSGSFQSLQYLFNELAFHPPGNQEGLLFWVSWFVHNWNSVLSSGDANGGIGRGAVLATCGGLQGMPQLQGVLGVAGLCPG
jgi:phospholipid/cholesterol/gamma-HCH transport system substrate-binding protein